MKGYAMKPLLILLAGYPGTGKSYLANMIMERYKDIVLCSPDMIKEAYWDHYGFDTLKEKEELITKSWNTYYQQIKGLLKQEHTVISDYPFSDKQKHILEECANQSHADILTIRLIGDLDVLYERQKTRDLNSTRHLGHIVTSYHKGMQITHDAADNLLDEEEFKRRCTTRGYGTFALGTTIEVDVSDFRKVNYDALLDEIGRQKGDLVSFEG